MNGKECMVHRTRVYVRVREMEKGENSSIALEALEKVPSKHSRRGWDLHLRTANWIEARTLL